MTQVQFMLPGALAVIGGGRMGEAIISGLLSSGSVAPQSVFVAEPVEERRRQLAESYGVSCSASAPEVAGRGDLVLLAVKPQVIDEVAASVADVIGSALVVSIAAGITCERLEALLPERTAVVRVMPNTPAMVGEGMSVVSGGTSSTPAQVETVRAMFEVFGRSILIDESLQDAATAISGSGPAYIAIFLDALAKAGEGHGLPRESALALASQTAIGTVKLLGETGMTPDELVQGVSSPGGTTVAATAALDENGFRETISAAVDAAVRRAKELGA